ncbi:SETMR methyltransferase, partial [Neodrepanis coruscans]|nr:SETMR methyltransferase [Neodrepanis coruscans]
QYSPECVAGSDGELDPCELTLPGCSCQNSSCEAPGCPCLRRGHNSSEDFSSAEDGERREQQEFSQPVFECNALCSCGPSCPSRRVQRGLQLRLQVFLTRRKGWAVRCLQPIPSGSFVCEYAGEVLGCAEARRRMEAQSPAEPNYILALREHLHGGRVLHTFVDPTRVGNVGRFLNHSCRPNLLMVPVRVHCMVPRMALFAARDIPAGEELCYDYSGRFQNPPGPGAQQEPQEDGDRPRKPCHCGSPACTAFLPWDSSLFATP